MRKDEIPRGFELSAAVVAKVAGRSARGQRTGVGNFVTADRPNLIAFDGDDGGGVPVEGQELDFERPSVLIKMDYRAHIAGF